MALSTQARLIWLEEIAVAVKLVGAAGGDTLKVAVTDVLADKVTEHVVTVPVQAPDQPPKTEPAAAAAVNVTDVPEV